MSRFMVDVGVAFDVLVELDREGPELVAFDAARLVRNKVHEMGLNIPSLTISVMPDDVVALGESGLQKVRFFLRNMERELAGWVGSERDGLELAAKRLQLVEQVVAEGLQEAEDDSSESGNRRTV